ncbi:hypothetical protein BGZ97_009005, partial [Linnemannia gamsii]
TAHVHRNQYFKWTRRGVGKYNSADSGVDDDTEDDSADLEEGSDGYLSDTSSSSQESSYGKRSREEDSDDEDEQTTSPIMSLADFDAGELETPNYSTSQTPGTAIRMLNGIVLEGGSLTSPASPASPARSIDLDAPRKLCEYKGYKKAFYKISEMATFEEDVEYAGHNEPLQTYLDRMEKRARDTDSEEEDIDTGPAYAAARAVAYPESESEDDRAAEDLGDTTPRASTTTRKNHHPEQEQEDHEDGYLTPKASGPGAIFYQESNNDANDALGHDKYNSHGDDALSGQELSDEGVAAKWAHYEDSDQETVRGYGSREDDDQKDLDNEDCEDGQYYYGSYNKAAGRTATSMYSNKDKYEGYSSDDSIDHEDDDYYGCQNKAPGSTVNLDDDYSDEDYSDQESYNSYGRDHAAANRTTKFGHGYEDE